MSSKNRVAERRNRLTIELAFCGLDPYAIAHRTGQGERRVLRLLRGVGLPPVTPSRRPP
jgi:hypothetical protein